MNELNSSHDCDTRALPSELAQAFALLEPDADAEAFAHQAQPHGMWKTTIFRALRTFVSDYDAYGLLGMYHMHLLSPTQWRKLLDLPEHPRGQGTYLDVGAGRGDITACLTQHFAQSLATEPAAPLRKHLPRAGFQILDRDLCEQELPNGMRFDLVTCLNVIDRVSYPKTLISRLRHALEERGQLVIAVPLPLRPHVDRGRATVAQEQPLPASDGHTFESQAASLVERFIRPLELRVTRMARAPYLCQGDAHKPLYALDDVILVCSRA